MHTIREHKSGDLRYVHGKTPVLILSYYGRKAVNGLGDRYFVVEIQETTTINKIKHYKGDKILMNSRNLYPNKGVKV